MSKRLRFSGQISIQQTQKIFSAKKNLGRHPQIFLSSSYDQSFSLFISSFHIYVIFPSPSASG
jgi:hypothetical protein